MYVCVLYNHPDRTLPTKHLLHLRQPVHTQVKGASMGSSLFAAVANIFMGDYEGTALLTAPHVA